MTYCKRCGSHHPVLHVPDVPSDKAAWAAIPETTQARFCGQTPVRFANLGTGRLGSFRPSCESHTCSTCGPKNAKKTVERAACLFAPLEQVAFTAFPEDKATRARLRQRRSGTRDGHLTVTGTNGNVYVLATDVRSGRKPPDRWATLRPQEGLDLLATVVAQPGVARVRFGGRWKETAPARPTTAASFGMIGEPLWKPALEATRDTLAVRYKLHHDPWVSDPENHNLPAAVPLFEFVATLQATLNATRQRQAP